MKIYLIRHGETTGDVEGRYGGDFDDSLSKAIFFSDSLNACSSSGILFFNSSWTDVIDINASL
jgi:hypothetical protein